MNKNKYLIRLDDACPTMDKSKWNRVLNILEKHDICPLIGIIPANEDPKQMYDNIPDFWETARTWQSKGWEIALHGYNHLYHTTNEKGINPIWNKSEFTGLSLDEQRKKIRNGLEILKNNGLFAKYFFAPSHTFDDNTLKALLLESDIRVIIDTIGNIPYEKDGFIFIPQVFGFPRIIPIKGIWTFCLHPNTMGEKGFEKLDLFLEKNKKNFISFNQLNFADAKPKKIFAKLLSFAYFKYRNLKK